jgi:folate-binding protein YgfZ
MTAPIRLTDGVFFDLSTRVKLRVIGADRVRFLNGQITNDIRKATEARAIESCVLNAKGKINAHFFVHTNGDSFLIDADPALQPILRARLERYIIADDVEIEDATAKLSIFHMISANPPGLSVPARVVLADRFGCAGFDVWCEASQHTQIKAEFGRHFHYCDEDCAERLRVERGIPRWGRELTGEIIPVEANLEQRCVDYEKGCYIGQETISRMKMSGQRNKQLCGLISLAGTAFAPGMRLISGPPEKDAGWITSATRSGDREIAIGYVKRGFNSVGTRLEAVLGEGARISTQVADLPFSP